jgi:hypothetical protein
MNDNGEPFVLLAMTPAGESALIADHDRVSLVRFSSRGRQRQDASADDAETAVRRYGWIRVDRAFSTWGDLDRFRTAAAEEAMRGFPDPTVRDYNRRDVEVVLKQVARSGPDRRVAAIGLLTDLLVRCPAVRRDDDLSAMIGERLEQLRSTPITADASAMSPEQERHELARLHLDYGIGAA